MFTLVVVSAISEPMQVRTEIILASILYRVITNRSHLFTTPKLAENLSIKNLYSPAMENLPIITMLERDASQLLKGLLSSAPNLSKHSLAIYGTGFILMVQIFIDI